MGLALTGELSFASALATLARARDAVRSGDGAVEIDLSAITRSDSAGLAMLLELTREAQRNRRELRLTRPPEQLRRLADFFGVSGLLPLA